MRKEENIAAALVLTALIGAGTFAVFLVLKLTGVSSWSWWWVTSPVWVPAGILAIWVGVLLATVKLMAPKDEFGHEGE